MPCKRAKKMPAPVPTPEQLLAPHEVPDVDMQAADQASKQEAAVAAAAAPPPTAAPPTSTQEHQALQERIGLYLTGALTSNLIMLGDK